MKLGVYNAILHDRPLPEALKVVADLGLTGIEINSGGFLPAVHVPTFDEGVRNMELLVAVTESALNNGRNITL